MVTYNLGQQRDGVKWNLNCFLLKVRNTLNGVLYLKESIVPVYCLKWPAASPYLEDYSFIRVRYEFKTPGIYKTLGGTLFVHLQRGRNPSQRQYSLSYFLLPYKYPFVMSRKCWLALIRSRFSRSILNIQRLWKGRFFHISLSAILIRPSWTNKDITKFVSLGVVTHVNLIPSLKFAPKCNICTQFCLFLKTFIVGRVAQSA